MRFSCPVSGVGKSAALKGTWTAVTPSAAGGAAWVPAARLAGRPRLRRTWLTRCFHGCCRDSSCWSCRSSQLLGRGVEGRAHRHIRQDAAGDGGDDDLDLVEPVALRLLRAGEGGKQETSGEKDQTRAGDRTLEPGPKNSGRVPERPSWMRPSESRAAWRGEHGLRRPPSGRPERLCRAPLPRRGWSSRRTPPAHSGREADRRRA
jgi:hypothetical protein